MRQHAWQGKGVPALRSNTSSPACYSSAIRWFSCIGGLRLFRRLIGGCLKTKAASALSAEAAKKLH